MATFGITTSTAFADLHDTSGRGAQPAWKAPPPESYPSGWNTPSTPAPQANDHNGTGTMSPKPTGQGAAPTPPENAQVIYQMVPGGHRYHRITQ